MTGKGDNECPAVLVPFALTLLGSRFVSVEYHLSLDNGGCPASRLRGSGRKKMKACGELYRWLWEDWYGNNAKDHGQEDSPSTEASPFPWVQIAKVLMPSMCSQGKKFP